MVIRGLLRVNGAALRLVQTHVSSRTLQITSGIPYSVTSSATMIRQPHVPFARHASTIPEEFDIDVEVPAASTKVPQDSAPFTESLSLDDGPAGTDWSRSYHGLSASPFAKEITDILLAPIDVEDIEIKPDGMIYLPEIKYRRILNKAFGPGGWGLAPRGETNVSAKVVSREYALVCLGRLVGIARGEQEFFDPSGIATATESCKSNALMRCCKDLGIASELWDPRFIREFKAKHCVEVFVEHVTTGKKRKLWRRKNDKFTYPYKE